MNRLLGGILFAYLFSYITFCLKVHITGYKEHFPKLFFLNNNYNNNNDKTWTKKGAILKKLKRCYKVFYKSKKERDILESGYLYPFDHLEKKKKKFPPDPYQPSEEEREKETAETYMDLFDEELNRNEFFYYDDEDAKQFFGKTQFSRPERVEEIEKGTIEDANEESGDAEPTEDYNTFDVEKMNTENNIKMFIDERDRGNDNTGEIKKEEKEKKNTKKERELIKINVYFSEGKELKAEMLKDQLYYLFHSCMDNTFNNIYQVDIVTYSKKTEENYEICVVYSNHQNVAIKTKVIQSLSDLIDFYKKVKTVLDDKIDMLNKKEAENAVYLCKNKRKQLEKNKKERKIINTSKHNLQMSIESSLKMIEKCKENMYKQNFELTLRDLKLAYTMLPCKYYGYFLSDLCANISILSFYVNDLQSAFDFALKGVKYEPKYFLSWKCLGDSYRSFRKFWQAKNVYDIAVYLGYTDTKCEKFKEIMKALNDLKKRALENVDALKENMNNHLHITVKKNIGIIINKNPDCLGGCYVSYIIERSKAGKKSFQHGDQIVSLNNTITFGKPIDFCLKAFQNNNGIYDVIFFKGNIIELYGLKAYKYLMENNLFSLLFENEKISSFKKNESILFDTKGFGTFSEYGVSKRDL